MYNYSILKKHNNETSYNVAFGKLLKLNDNALNLQNYSIIWCADSGLSFRKHILKEANSIYSTNQFISNQTSNKYEHDQILRLLTDHPGSFYSVQCGGCSNVYLLIKTPKLDDSELDENHIVWNACRFLRLISWVASTDMTENINLSVSDHVNSTEVKWTSLTDKKLLIDAIPTLNVHWVWFRRPGYKLTQEIIERATSWIVINPDIEFHLWTDIPTQEDVDDFLSDIIPSWRDYFISHVTIHLNNETTDLMNWALNELLHDDTKEGIELLKREFASTEKQARVYKTDFTRLFILYKHGGIYTDFNDLLCLAPAKDLIAIYGSGQPLGVTDLADLNHASNYFLYSPSGNTQWFNIMKSMIADVKYLVRMIRDNEIMEAVRIETYKLLDTLKEHHIELKDFTNLHTIFNRQSLPCVGNERITGDLWNRILYVILEDISPNQSIKHVMTTRVNELKRNRKPNRMRRNYPQNLPTLNDDDILLLKNALDSNFSSAFLFWWTDYNLRTLMHYTNLPIYCRMRKLHLELVPYGYYVSYCCMLSWFGHLGDGTSYGFDGRKDMRISNIYNSIGTCQ